MTKSCKYCGRVHQMGERCPREPARKKEKQTTANKLRSTWRWTKKAKAIKDRDLFLCLNCLAAGKITTTELETHHIVPIEEDDTLALDDDNLITLCGRCHEEAERGNISREKLRQLVAAGVRGTPRVGVPYQNTQTQDHERSFVHKKSVK